MQRTKNNPVGIDSKLKKVVMTGGHAASSAFVVAQEVKRQKKHWKLYWLGFKSSFEGESISTLSSIYFPKYDIQTHNLITGRIQRRWTVHAVSSLIKIPIGFFQTFFILVKIRPDLVLSFGGFSSFPVVVIANLFKIPVIIHEQTSVVGRANKYSAPFATKIAISRESSREYFPQEKTVLVGNPVPKEISFSKNKQRAWLKPQIMITGGQSGAVTINEKVKQILGEILINYRVIHLTGLKQEDEFQKFRSKLEDRLKKNYKVYGIVDPNVYNSIFNTSTIIISRAGANTISKIIVSKKPSILIPLPASYLNEQEKNALFAKKYAAARVVKQENLASFDLVEEINFIVKNWQKKLKGLKKLENPDIYAAENIVRLVQNHIK